MTSERPLRLPDEQSPPRQFQSLGIAGIFMDFPKLLEQYRQSLARRVLKRLRNRAPVNRLAERLEEAGLSDGFLSGVDRLRDHAPAKIDWAPGGDSKDILTLATRSEDLADDNGNWSETDKELDRAFLEIRREITVQIGQFAQTMMNECGFSAVQGSLGMIREKFRTFLMKLAPTKPVNAEQLRTAAQALRTIARRMPVWRALGSKILPKSLLLWPSESDRTAIERRWLPVIQQGNRLRHAASVERRLRKLYEDLLTPDGFLAHCDARFQKKDERYQTIFGAESLAVEAHVEESLHTIELVRHLDEPLDLTNGNTLHDHYDAAAANAGVTVEAIAARFEQEGIFIGGRRCLPGEWPELPVAVVRDGVEHIIAEMLGVPDPDDGLDIERPTTALEGIAAITLLHPAFSKRLQTAIDTMTQRAQPYLEHEPLENVQTMPLSYLSCYPPQRGQWLRKLQHLRVSDEANRPDLAGAYGVRHPYAVEVFQVDLAIPLGTAKGLASWRKQNHQQSQSASCSPLVPAEKYANPCYLIRRSDDVDDARQLLEAAITARIMVPLDGASDRYVPATLDARIRDLFAPPRLIARWRKDEVFLDELRNDQSRYQLCRMFSSIKGIQPELDQLAHEDDATLVARRLVELEILEAGVARTNRVMSGHVPETHLPELFLRKPGPLQGIERAELIGRLGWDDLLYNLLFWKVCDALTLGRISPNQVPPYLRDFQARM